MGYPFLRLSLDRSCGRDSELSHLRNRCQRLVPFLLYQAYRQQLFLPPDIYALLRCQMRQHFQVKISLHHHRLLLRLYNPQNETCNAHRTKGAKIKTKRAVLTKRSVPSVRFFLSSVDPPFSKKFRPGFAGFCGPAPALPCPALSVYLNGLRMMFGGRSSRLVALRFGSLRDRFGFAAHATSTIALNAATLCALTSLPRKARRDPTTVCAYEASKLAYANDTPPFAFA